MAARLCARSRMRSSWLGIVASMLLVGLVGAVVIAGVAGARRTDNAFDRMKEETHAAVLRVFSRSEVSSPVVEELRALPGVQSIGLGRQLTAEVEGTFINFAAPLDDEVGKTIERPRLLKGRRARQDRVREIAVPESFAERADLSISDTFTISTYSPADVAEAEAGGPPTPSGPSVRMRVVGITRAPGDLSIEGDGGGILFATRAFLRRFGEEIGSFAPTVFLVRAETADAGQRVVEVARARIAADLGPGEFQAQPTSEVEGGVQDSIGVVTVGLLAFAAVAAVAGFTVVGVALRRGAENFRSELPILRALGVSRASRMLTVVIATLPAVVGGAMLAVSGAIALSPLMPLGLARRAEPNLGVQIDGLVLGLGFVGMLSVGLGVSAWAAWRVDVLSSSVEERAPAASRFTRHATAAGLGPTATAGLAMALDPGRGPRAVPVRTAVVAIIVAVTGLIAVAGVGASLEALPSTPRAYGYNWDAQTYVRTEGQDGPAGGCAGLHTSITQDRAVGAISQLCSTNAQVDGQPVSVFGFSPMRGDIDPTILEGRAPRTPSEVALGTLTLAAVQARIGDTVEIAGSESTARFLVVGRVALPVLSRNADNPQAVADGAAVTGRGFESIGLDEGGAANVVLRWRQGVDHDEAERRIRGDAPGIAPLVGPEVPLEVERLQQVDMLPWILGAFLALIGGLGLAYALIATVRRRSSDLATLKTLGFRRRQIAFMVAVQATVLATGGVLIGVPIGVVIGRVAWERIMERSGMAAVVSLPVLLVAVLAFAVLLVANVVAVTPARRAARLLPARVLRSE